MLWDASWDQQNVIQGKVYSDHIADIISESGNSGKPTGVPTTATPGYTPTSDGSITPGGTLPPTTPGGSPPPTAGGSTPSTLPVVPTSPPSPGGGDGLGMWDFFFVPVVCMCYEKQIRKNVVRNLEHIIPKGWNAIERCWERRGFICDKIYNAVCN